MLHPTRCENIVSDTFPSEYQLDCLPESVKSYLKPCFENDVRLNSGRYLRMARTSTKAVYVYEFPHTQADSKADRESLEIDSIVELYKDLNKELPPVQNSEIVFTIPTFFADNKEIEEN